jgi:hypothetical protein
MMDDVTRDKLLVLARKNATTRSQLIRTLVLRAYQEQVGQQRKGDCVMTVEHLTEEQKVERQARIIKLQAEMMVAMMPADKKEQVKYIQRIFTIMAVMGELRVPMHPDEPGFLHGVPNGDGTLRYELRKA